MAYEHNFHIKAHDFFSHKNNYIFLKHNWSPFGFFLERFGQYLKKSKNGFPIVFSKCDLASAEAGIKNIFYKRINRS